jgi:hypothetical protein
MRKQCTNIIINGGARPLPPKYAYIPSHFTLKKRLKLILNCLIIDADNPSKYETDDSKQLVGLLL